MKVRKIRKILPIAIAALLAAVAFAGCFGSNESNNGEGHASEGLRHEDEAQKSIENEYAKAQPIPVLTNSQVRQNLIEIQEAIAEGVETTSFFFNLGQPDPVKSCPSIGVPIPASAQLTNPEQVIKEGEHNDGSLSIPQMDPDGIYVGETTGTFVLCIESKGKPYVSYWEGYVLSEFAPAKWNYDEHHVELIGSSSWEFSKHTPPSGTTASE
jgi:hypothetical protein